MSPIGRPMLRSCSILLVVLTTVITVPEASQAACGDYLKHVGSPGKKTIRSRDATQSSANSTALLPEAAAIAGSTGPIPAPAICLGWDFSKHIPPAPASPLSTNSATDRWAIISDDILTHSALISSQHWTPERSLASQGVPIAILRPPCSTSRS